MAGKSPADAAGGEILWGDCQSTQSAALNGVADVSKKVKQAFHFETFRTWYNSSGIFGVYRPDMQGYLRVRGFLFFG
jgi:hypothetical protein